MNDNANTSYKVGDVYYWWNFVRKNSVIAYQYYQKTKSQLAYDDSDNDIKSDTYYRLALCLFRGIGTEKNLFGALAYINKAHPYSYYDCTHDKFNWQSIAKKIEELRATIIGEFDDKIESDNQGE
ncbi:hypothetical protein [Limosilactobacillus oris]|uniref:hypothetical protein n=1 Tax=Limosilactobacillus oris TaxID=1632 RepID=UPI002658691C|nr:hypothetical protein [Limosilactobacillus oris]